MCNIAIPLIESIYRASGLDVKLSCLLHLRGLTYFFDAETAVLMATVPATLAQFSHTNFQKEVELERYFVVSATDIFTATKEYQSVLALSLW